MYVCVRGGRGGDGIGDPLISNSVYVGRGVGGTGKVIHLFQTALKNLGNKYCYFGQFLIMSSVV